MNKSGYQPLPVLLRAESIDTRTSKSATILRVIAALGTLLALSGVVAVFLIAFKAFPVKTVESTAPVAVSVLPESTMSPATTAGHDDGAGTLVPDSNQAHSQTITGDRAILDQTATSAPNPISAPAAPPKTEASANERTSLKDERPEIGQANPGKRLPEAVRKKLEKTRLAAERKRVRLEELYRANAISSKAYEKGEEKYQRAIERYRQEMGVRLGLKNDVAGQN